MKVLVTRAQPANTKTCEALTELGHNPISLPIFELTDTGVSIPQQTFDGYIFTSSNAAQVLLMRENIKLNSSLPVYCVGERTAKSVAQLGFKNIEIANGNAQTLVDLIIAKNLSPDTSLLYFTTKDRSFDISAYLESSEIKVTNLDLYQMDPIEIEQEQIIETIAEVMNGTILVYSKRSGERLAHLLKQSQIDVAALNISLLAISKKAASALKTFPWESLQIAAVANEQSMFHILDK